MNEKVQMENEFEAVLKETIKAAVEEAIAEHAHKEWMTLAEGADYIGIAFNTFKQFVAEGLKISQPAGSKRKFVSRTEIDRFLNEYSY